MFQSWSVIPFQRSKQRARLLDADQFTWSQLRFLNESSKDHIWILCANKTSQNNKAKLSEDLERIRTSECSPATFLKTTVSQCSRTMRKLFISSALSGSRDPTLQILNLYKDYKLHSWWCWCCSCAANVVLVSFCFSLITSTSVFQNPLQHSLSRRFQKRLEHIWYLGWMTRAEFNGKPWAQKSGPALGWTTSQQQMCQLLWIFHCLRIDFQCDVD